MSSAAAPRIVVALDGPASSGKTSVGRAVAERLGLRFLDTGLAYRALTALALREGIAPEDGPALAGLVGRIGLADDGTGRLDRVLVDGADATAGAHSHEVDAAVSMVAREPDVRAALLGLQRALAAPGGIVVAGRDIGTVVLPSAELKVYLDASADERAARRIRERGLDPAGPDAAAVRDGLRSRDALDSGRAVAPLRRAADAVPVHTDGLTLDEVVDRVEALARDAEARGAGDPRAGAPSADPPGSQPPAPGPATPPAPERRPRVLEVALRLDNDQTMLVRVVARVAQWIGHALASVSIEGLENLPRRGAVILAANHASNLDPILAGAWVSDALRTRRIHWLGKRELFSWPLFGWMCALGGVHPVDRSTTDIEAFRLATRILERGYVLLIFPEGTRSPTGALQEAKDGMAQLALRTGAQIVPIGISDSDRVWPKGRRLPSPFPRRRVRVRIGEPFLAADVVPPSLGRREAKAAATRAIMGRIASLLAPRQRGFYATAAADAPGAGGGR